MRAHGRVNVAGLAIVVAVIGGIYWVIMFSGVYLENLDVKEIVAACFNDSGRTGDDIIRNRINDKLSKIGTHKADDGFGNLTVVPGLGLPPEQITIFRDEVRKTILIKVDYTREVQLKPLAKIKVLHFVVVKEGLVPTQ